MTTIQQLPPLPTVMLWISLLMKSKPMDILRSLPRRWDRIQFSLLVISILSYFPTSGSAQSDRVVITSQPGYSIAWDGNNGGFSNPEVGAAATNNPALASNGSTAFGSSEVGLNIHFIPNVIDGFYGNSSSWIADFAGVPPDTNAFVGVSFGKTVNIASIAWGRDNGDNTEPGCGGTCTDRAVGIYTLQVTSAPNPGATTPEADSASTGWFTIGTVEYKPGTENAIFSAYLRHRFEVAKDGNPIAATGLRIKVSSNQIAIDEIEVNPGPDPIPPLSNFIVIQPSGGYAIAWDKNDGEFYDPGSPAKAPNNRALAVNGTTAFGSSEFGSGVHFITNVIDGLYGNSHSWISNFGTPDPNPYIGLNFGATIEIKNIAWSRDNGDNTEAACGGTCTDGVLGVYTIQITKAAKPGPETAETGDPATGWVTIGIINYKSAGESFTPHLRHRFDVTTAVGDSIQATGLRIKVSDANTAIDEIEINGNVAQELDLVVIQSSPDFSIQWDGNDGDFYDANAGARAPENLSLAANGASAFGSSELGFGIHFIPKVNDGFYGNSSSWISDQGLGAGTDSDPFIGIKFGKNVSIKSIAWGRDNGDATEGGCGGTCLDRSLGVYTLQVTSVANPGKETTETSDAATGWITIGTVEYVREAPPGFNPSRRHRFDVATKGQPISATALRIKVSSGQLDIDEIEVNPTGLVLIPPITDLLTINSAAGYSITWDGNDGEFNNPDTNAAAPSNLALASKGASAFGSSEADLGVHFISNINDGFYGNSHSWIAKFTDPADNDPFIGVNFGKTISIRSIAWGRDNGNVDGDCCGGTLTDRAIGTYTLQITTAANPGPNTPEAASPSSGWVTIGTLEYKAAFVTLFNPHLRHRFNVSSGGASIPATGLRIKVSSNQIDIDEIEVNPLPIPDNNILVIESQPGYSVVWDGSNGDFSTTNSPAPAPDNLARASRGATAFASSQVDLGVHFATNLNDGFYGNSHCWIADFSANPDPDPFAGINFGKTIAIENIAWGRDNGDVAGDCCGGTLTDRATGTYTLQITTLPNPTVDTPETDDAATGWATIGTVVYRGAGSPAFRHHLRHGFDVSKDGQPIAASGLRIKVSSNQIAIDELEVNSVLSAPQPVINLVRQGNNVIISWTGTATLQSADDVAGPWGDVPGATSPLTVPIASGPRKFYRLRQ